MIKLKLFFSLLIIVKSNFLSSQFTFHLTIDYVKTTQVSAAIKKEIPELTALQPILYRYEYSEGKSFRKFIKGIGESRFKAMPFSNIYKDLEKKVLYLTLIKDSTIVSKDTLICENWELHPGEVKVIAGYTCHKAISEHSYLAWYCEDIPVPDGPLENTCGLPGIILALKQGDTNIEAINVELSNSGSPVMLPIVEKYSSKEEFRKGIQTHK